MLRTLFQRLGPRGLRAQLAEFSEALQPAGVKLGLRKLYGEVFDRARAAMQAAQDSGAEIQAMLSGTFRQLNADFGFSLQVPPALSLGSHVQAITAIEQRHVQYLGVANALRLAQKEYAQRLLHALALRLRTVYEATANELELWNMSVMAQLDAQLRERERSFARRMEAVGRIQNAASGLVERIAEIEEAERNLAELELRLAELTAELVRQPAPDDEAPQALGMAHGADRPMAPLATA